VDSDTNSCRMVDKRAKYRWADLRPFPGYSVSTDGRVKDRHKNELAVRLGGDGPFVRMWVNGVRRDMPVRFLVAYAFHGTRSARYRVAHVNGNEDDCRAENLVWIEPPIDYEQLMRAPRHRGYPARLDASTLALVCATYSGEYGTNFSIGEKDT
jgi:HNH endonuclease